MEYRILATKAFHYILDNFANDTPPRYEPEAIEELVNVTGVGRCFSYLDAIRKSLRLNYMFLKEVVDCAMSCTLGQILVEYIPGCDTFRMKKCCQIMSFILNLTPMDSDDDYNLATGCQLQGVYILDTLGNLTTHFNTDHREFENYPNAF